jgi:hypothetical protein
MHFYCGLGHFPGKCAKMEEGTGLLLKNRSEKQNLVCMIKKAGFSANR